MGNPKGRVWIWGSSLQGVLNFSSSTHLQGLRARVPNSMSSKEKSLHLFVKLRLALTVISNDVILRTNILTKVAL